MSKVKVTCEVSSYDEPAKPGLKVHSHWSRDKMVVLEIDGKSVTVIARHLKAAIENCTNTANS